ncbi:hypothetical protein H4R33_004701 [Dimargaris cristalligena]|uniref:MRN complex-interacting protein N-terminal domain-containing protein n=1 Tax=Dimargaris cristalligena TaxID=215637 RepID=A0A4P9ZMI7_9FUNG|nr:hypothetical protein H4R33_004701 [Dimargaris cristalligena]RKP34308.1 hypothetical protein BJ085DRAFT_33106 [Dimargaris cristalligena]|eukprot:RKP34308.1 hypothetical protein BJ085DRAFT_33106 [Dimargaris cristalligena]
MPLYRVLRCFDAPCGAFQVHQAKKANRWQCKICNQRQSLKRVYAESEDSAECRRVVQTLNMRRGDHPTSSPHPPPSGLVAAATVISGDNSKPNTTPPTGADSGGKRIHGGDARVALPLASSTIPPAAPLTQSADSKWATFVNIADDLSGSDEDDCTSVSTLLNQPSNSRSGRPKPQAGKRKSEIADSEIHSGVAHESGTEVAATVIPGDPRNSSYDFALSNNHRPVEWDPNRAGDEGVRHAPACNANLPLEPDCISSKHE